jgi:hypothetical protein
MATHKREVIVIDRRGKRVVVSRVKNPLDIMTALNAAGDLVAVKELFPKRAGKKRKNPFGEGKCPPHLKKYRFRKS